MVKKKGMPEFGELVIGKITRINPNSAFVSLEEYAGAEGMVHISEISSGWVRDIRSHVKLGQGVVAKVVRVEGNYVGLSLKRVDDKQKREKLREYNLNQKAERMLELVGKKLGKSLDEMYIGIGFKLQEAFGTLYDAFLKAMSDPDALKGKAPDDVAAAIREVAEKSIELKVFEFKAKLFLKTNKPNGINTIKDILVKAEKSGLDVKYISAPEYHVSYKTKNAKKGGHEFDEKLNKIVSGTKGVEASFEMM